MNVRIFNRLDGAGATVCIRSLSANIFVNVDETVDENDAESVNGAIRSANQILNAISYGAPSYDVRVYNESES